MSGLLLFNPLQGPSELDAESLSLLFSSLLHTQAFNPLLDSSSAMASKDAELDVGPVTPPLSNDPEKGSGSGNEIPDDFREKDFMTRNGLNLQSFQRRKFNRQCSLATLA